MWTLTITGPNLPVQQRTLNPGGTVCVGRADDNEVVLPSESVSRRHVQFIGTPQGIRVADLGSRNGTRLNGHPLGHVSRPFQAGDVVSVGDFVMKVDEGRLPRPVRRSTRGAEHADGFITLRAGAVDDNPYLTRVHWRGNEVTQAREPVEPRFAAMLFELAEQLATGMEARRFVEQVLQCARLVTGFDGLLLRPDGDGLAAVAGPDERAPRPILFSTTIVQAALSRRSTLVVNHLPSDARFNTGGSVVLARQLHVICCPLTRGEQTHGALYLTTATAELPQQATVDFLTSISQLAAAALERAVLAGGPAPASSGPLRRIEDSAAFLDGALLELGCAISGGEAAALLEEARAATARIRHALASAQHP